MLLFLPPPLYPHNNLLRLVKGRRREDRDKIKITPPDWRWILEFPLSKLQCLSLRWVNCLLQSKDSYISGALPSCLHTPPNKKINETTAQEGVHESSNFYNYQHNVMATNLDGPKLSFAGAQITSNHKAEIILDISKLAMGMTTRQLTDIIQWVLLSQSFTLSVPSTLQPN